MLKKIIVCVVVVLLGFNASKDIFRILKDDLIQENARKEIKIDAKYLETAIISMMQNGGKDIFLNIHFESEDAVLVHAELKHDRIGDFFSLPQWLSQTFPESITLDMKIRPYLGETGKIQLQMMKLNLNSTEMPSVIGEAVCVGLTQRINEYIEKQGVEVKTLRIADGSLGIEIEKSSGR